MKIPFNSKTFDIQKVLEYTIKILILIYIFVNILIYIEHTYYDVLYKCYAVVDYNLERLNITHRTHKINGIIKDHLVKIKNALLTGDLNKLTIAIRGLSYEILRAHNPNETWQGYTIHLDIMCRLVMNSLLLRYFRRKTINLFVIIPYVQSFIALPNLYLVSNSLLMSIVMCSLLYIFFSSLCKVKRGELFH